MYGDAMIPDDFENKDSRHYRFPRTSGLHMRDYTFRPAPEIPDTPGWVWFVWGLAIGAALIALALA